MNQFRVIDLQTEAIDPNEIVVHAASPEDAARRALGADLVRSGAKRDLRARVYFTHPGAALSMVRLYARITDR